MEIKVVTLVYIWRVLLRIFNKSLIYGLLTAYEYVLKWMQNVYLCILEDIISERPMHLNVRSKW